jgi:hypothetical protein
MTEKEFWESMLASETPKGPFEVEEAMSHKQFDSLSVDGVALTNQPLTLSKQDAKVAENGGSTFVY